MHSMLLGLGPRRARSALLSVTVVAAFVGCNRSRVLSVRDLEHLHSTYRGRVLTVRGCYHNGVETTVLQPCVNAKPNEILPVLFRSQLEDIRKYVPGYAIGSTAYERPSAEELHLEAELSALPNGVQVEVLLRGECTWRQGRLEASEPHETEFVVHRVLRVVAHQVR